MVRVGCKNDENVTKETFEKFVTLKVTSIKDAAVKFTIENALITNTCLDKIRKNGNSVSIHVFFVCPFETR